jgi:hypothetical protein
LAVAESAPRPRSLDSSKLPKLSVAGRKPYSLSYDEIDRHLRGDITQ